MPKCHHIKLSIQFCGDVLNGNKCFEVRENDRGYQKGDLVQFEPYDPNKLCHHPIEDRTYVITYVLNGWGLKNGFVAFGIKEAKEQPPCP